jgi:hypothetical protein
MYYYILHWPVLKNIKPVNVYLAASEQLAGSWIEV